MWNYNHTYETFNNTNKTYCDKDNMTLYMMKCMKKNVNSCFYH